MPQIQLTLKDSIAIDKFEKHGWSYLSQRQSVFISNVIALCGGEQSDEWRELQDQSREVLAKSKD